MVVEFSLYEMIYNNNLSGRLFYPNGSEDTSIVETIDYVKAKKDIRTINIHCVSGNIYPLNIDKEYAWEVNNDNPASAPNKPKIKGKS